MLKIILITGCSSGLGLHLAKRLSQKHIVYASMRKPKDIEKMKEHASDSFRPIQLDVTETESIERAIAHIENEQQRLDVLVNNAGILHLGCFEDVSLKAYKEMYETNFFGVLDMTKRALPLLKKSSEGKIVNISSSSAIAAMPTMSAYTSSKWAIEGFSESLRYELLPFGIKVLLIEPGIIKTKMVNENFKTIENPKSDSYPILKSVLTHWEELKKHAFLEVDAVSQVIEKRIDAKNPPFRTLLSRLAFLKLIARRCLPFSLFEKIIQKALKV